MTSHFDAWGLGENPSAKRKTRIENMEDLERVRSHIGEQNFVGVQRAHADGALVWVFLSEEEITQDVELWASEKSQCLEIFRSQKLGWAGWVRQPVRPALQIPGITVDPNYDTHGNYRGRGSSERSRH